MKVGIRNRFFSFPGRLALIAAAGVTPGFSYLTRVAGIFEAAVPAAWALVASKGRRKKLVVFASFVVGVFILAAPSIVRLRIGQGSRRLTGQQGMMMYQIIADPGQRKGTRHKIDPSIFRLDGAWIT